MIFFFGGRGDNCVAVAWCRPRHRHCIAVDIAIAVLCWPSFFLRPQCANFIACRATALWLRCALRCGNFAMRRDAVEFLFKPWRCSLFRSVARRATTLFFVLWHCASCHSFARCAMALCSMVQRYASCQAFCFVPQTLHFMPQTLRFVPQHWRRHFMVQ